MFDFLLIATVLGLGFTVDYLISDDDDDEPETLEVTLGSQEARFDGSDAHDHVTGNAMDNMLTGGAGNDLLAGLEGNDTLSGGDGDDRLFAGAGDDAGIGGTGNDRLFLGDGDDTTQPALDAGHDAGDDLIRGGAGADMLIDGQGSNTLFGDLQNDRLIAVDGLQADGTVESSDKTPDRLDAGYGNDTLVGDEGDMMTGGPGDDLFVVAVPSIAPDAPAVVTDFDIRDDLFSVIFLQDTPADDTVHFAFDASASVLRAHVDGQEVATLSGLTASDIPFINTLVATLPELMDAAS